MCEFLVRTVDKVNDTSAALDAECLKAGDVVVVCPDGWPWSKQEQEASFWRIIKVPGMSVEEGEQFLGRETGFAKRRATKIDLAQVATDTAEKSELLAAKVVKPASVSLDVLGEDPKVL
jgi:hypothetical protein